mmetsp:Transcript_9459/g.28764  ORF Transcript_9459/g.28764 Transcript_9459/m.28764 type:complete len:277 (+) Transcript_9459:532-1362(+)
MHRVESTLVVSISASPTTKGTFALRKPQPLLVLCGVALTNTRAHSFARVLTINSRLPPRFPRLFKVNVDHRRTIGKLAHRPRAVVDTHGLPYLSPVASVAREAPFYERLLRPAQLQRKLILFYHTHYVASTRVSWHGHGERHVMQRLLPCVALRPAAVVIVERGRAGRRDVWHRLRSLGRRRDAAVGRLRRGARAIRRCGHRRLAWRRHGRFHSLRARHARLTCPWRAVTALACGTFWRWRNAGLRSRTGCGVLELFEGAHDQCFGYALWESHLVT